jgi:hypothetical protein
LYGGLVHIGSNRRIENSPNLALRTKLTNQTKLGGSLSLHEDFSSYPIDNGGNGLVSLVVTLKESNEM